ncbi:LacI family DNA-binding transcriptional regulator [Microbacterium paraoxydans]|uniref:LacI family DNA-binding transcriptional regulator n=1 Tax=Microbacterium paraoxydans TaxID=199592 RepID=UPI0027E0E920|nr:LacI family DNA-binding transcriptional regulator [Microbacterium paraoxydans]
MAEIAGVAPSTVSRYLNGKLEIAVETEGRIRAAMAEIGYSKPQTEEPSGKTPLIAIVVPRVEIAYFADLADRVADAAERAGLETVICTTRSRGFKRGSLIEQLLALPVAGVVFAGTNKHNEGVRQFQEAGIPVVAIAEPVRGLELDSVRVDYRSGAHQAVAYLASLGHRSIAMIAGPSWLESNLAARSGFEDALRQCGIEPRADLQLFGEISRDFGYSALSQLLLETDRPTAIYVTADEIALGVYWAARDLGVTLPDELSIVGSDDISMAQFLTPALTSVRLPRDKMADRAIDILLSRLAGEDSGEVSDLVLPVTLQVRSSATNPM